MPTQARPFTVRSDNLDSYPPDRGCALHPSCLSCPRAICAEDELPERIRQRRHPRMNA
ncbi:MAG: hypothetical protein NTZ05_14385 [Chloroflexi bacterium]|nr:hypothetical protein [Chloroflexota bacterium]